MSAVPAESIRSEESWHGASVAALILLTIIAYLPALDAGYIWDDDAYVTGNRTLVEPGGLGRIWLEPGATPQYYPVVFTSFWIEQRLSGADPFGYHLVNVLLHLLNALLLWRLLVRLRIPGAFLAAALFAVHPVGVESVAWIAERKNVLSGMFYLATLLVWERIDGFGVRSASARHRGLLALALLLFVLAVLSKSVTASLPAVVLLLIYWKRGRVRMDDVMPMLPFLLVAGMMAWRTAWVEEQIVGIGRFDLDLDVVDRLLIAGRAVWFYLGKLLLPVGLAFVYPRWPIDPSSPVQVAMPALLVVLALALFFSRRSLGRGPLVVLLFFVGTLVPALGFVDFFPMLYAYVADHFQYLASIGPLTLIAAFVGQGLARLRGTALLLGRGVLALVLMLLMVLTWQRCQVMQSSESLFRDTLEKNPTAAMAYVNLASAASRRGETSAALDLLLRAETIDPAWNHASVRAKVQHNIGERLIDLQQYEQAIERFENARRILPVFWDPAIGIGKALLLMGRKEQAIEQLEEVLRAVPDHHMARHWLEQARRG